MTDHMGSGLGYVGWAGLGSDTPVTDSTTVPTPEQAVALLAAENARLKTINDNMSAGLENYWIPLAQQAGTGAGFSLSSLFPTLTAAQSQQITWIMIAALGVIVVMNMTGGTGGRRR